MKKEIIKLDGRQNGFAVFNLAAQDFIKNKNGEVLFRNIDLAKIYAANVKKLNNPYDYDLYIALYGSFIPYDNFEKIDQYYQLYADCNGEEVKYFVEPSYTRNIVKNGYLVVNNGTRENDKDAGIAKSNFYYKEALAAVNKLVRSPFSEPSVSGVQKDKYGICVSLKNTTAKIHICYNSQIMNINQKRKESNLRAFRFDKAMDKYTTLYTFIDIDAFEPEWINGIEMATKIINEISRLMIENDKIQSVEYNNIELLWPILLEGKKESNKKG